MACPLVESVICLSARMRETSENKEGCYTLSTTYKPIQLCKDVSKREKIDMEVREVVSDLYSRHREELLNRDFSFLREDKLILSGVNIGLLYYNVLGEGNDDRIGDVTRELLQLFYHVMNKEDQATILSRYKRKKKQKVKANPTIDMGSKMQKIMEKHAPALVNSESNPDAAGEVLTSVFKENTDDLVQMAQSFLKGTGLDPAKMNKQAKKVKSKR